MNTTAIEQATLNHIERFGTPCLLTFWKNRGNCPSVDIWCSDRAVPVIAFSAERMSARISMIAISHSSALLPAPVPNTFAPKLTKIVFGSTSAALPSAGRPRTMMNATGIIV